MTGTVYLVRHANAGARAKSKEPDELRPLTSSGWRQAHALVRVLDDPSIARIISSPHIRCIQTVEPLSVARGMPVEPSASLGLAAAGSDDDGAWLDRALELMVGASPAVLCSHREIIGPALARLVAEGVPLDAAGQGRRKNEGPPHKKGSVWALSVEDGRVVFGRYLPPPRGSREA